MRPFNPAHQGGDSEKLFNPAVQGGDSFKLPENRNPHPDGWG